MQIQEVLEKVKVSMVNSCGVEKEDVELGKTLIEDLDIDSIDLIDLTYNLEKEFDVKIEISEFESIARSKMGDRPFEVDRVITEEGLKVLRELMPEVETEKIYSGMNVMQIPFLFTVESLCKLVIRNKTMQ